jgi:hypothetical protein
MPARIHSLVHRILSRLASAEAYEINPWLRDDIRIARLTVLHAARGDAVECSPHVLSSYEVLGLHPDRVWPAIQARREAVGWPPFEEVCDAPKKPSQSVKLWFEKTNAARVSSSRGAMQQGSPRTTISVPMAAPSIAALYPNPDAPSSAKTRGFTYAQLLDIVRHSYVRAAVRRATLNALTARGSWPGEDGPASGIICVALDGMALGDEDGDGPCSRRTAQRRAKLACQLGYWRLLHKFNRWLSCPKCGAERTSATCPNEQCKHRGRSRNRDGSTNTKEFCRPYTFEIDIEKFLTATPPKFVRHFCARTWKEHKTAARRGEHPNVTEMPSRKPAQTDAPPPTLPPTAAAPLKRPAAEHAHRSPERRLPSLTTRQRAELVRRIPIFMKGCHGTQRAPEGGMGTFVGPEDPRYIAPMDKHSAMLAACKSMCEGDEAYGFRGQGVSMEKALEALADAGFKVDPESS